MSLLSCSSSRLILNTAGRDADRHLGGVLYAKTDGWVFIVDSGSDSSYFYPEFVQRRGLETFPKKSTAIGVTGPLEQLEVVSSQTVDFSGFKVLFPEAIVISGSTSKLFQQAASQMHSPVAGVIGFDVLENMCLEFRDNLAVLYEPEKGVSGDSLRIYKNRILLSLSGNSVSAVIDTGSSTGFINTEFELATLPGKGIPSLYSQYLGLIFQQNSSSEKPNLSYIAEVRLGSHIFQGLTLPTVFGPIVSETKGLQGQVLVGLDFLFNCVARVDFANSEFSIEDVGSGALSSYFDPLGMAGAFSENEFLVVDILPSNPLYSRGVRSGDAIQTQGQPRPIGLREEADRIFAFARAGSLTVLRNGGVMIETGKK